MPGKRRNRPSEVLLHISGKATNQELGAAISQQRRAS
jgi:hypothetical protein